MPGYRAVGLIAHRAKRVREAIRTAQTRRNRVMRPMGSHSATRMSPL